MGFGEGLSNSRRIKKGEMKTEHTLVFNSRDCTFDSSNDFVAQLVEQQTLNLWVLSSSLHLLSLPNKSKEVVRLIY